MPQDKRRLISYKSFVTCDDPNGIECGAIRKSKINSQIKEQNNTSKVEIEPHRNKEKEQKTVKEEEREKKEMVIKGITREIETSPVTFQLLEVSKEADKLNHVINSWSNDNQNNNNIAKDLLKGALDLQESLAMLEKLRDASSFMLGMSKIDKQKREGGIFEGMKGFERSRIESNGRYSRKSCDEMRSVVRDSLLRQNVMITNPVFEEQCYDNRRRVSPDMLPSTSSSLSSMFYSSNFVPSDSSVSSLTNSQKKKGKESNLIVKLMGLESFPSSPRRHAEKEKIVNLVKPLYDYDSPRAKRPQFGEVGMKQRSVEEILENLKFKGLLRNSSVDGVTVDSEVSEVFCPKNNSWVDERPPIVVMKPIRYPCLDLDGPYMPKFWGETIMKPRHGRGAVQEPVRNEAVNFSEKYEVPKGFDSKGKMNYNKRVTSSKVKDSVNVPVKPPKKQVEVTKASEVEKVTRTRRKVEEKKDAKSSDQLSSQDQEKCTTLKIKRQKDGKSIPKNQTSNQQKMAPSTVSDHRKRGTSERKKNRLSALVVEEKRICKTGKKECEVIYMEGSDLRRNSKSILPTVNCIISDDNDKERCQIPLGDYDLHSQTKLLETPEEISYLPSEKKTSYYDDNQSSYSEITSVSTNENCGVDQLGEAQSPLCEVTLITTHENGIAVYHDTNQERTKSLQSSTNSPRTKDCDSLRQSVTPRTKLKTLLLSNTSWVNHVEELFNVQVHPDSISCVIDDRDQDLESPRLLIECANEVLELKSLQYLQECLPLPRRYPTNSQNSPSLDWLLEEVCNGIEDLRCYSRPDCDNFPSDNLYVLLDRDLKLKNGIWGIGWRNMYTQDEVEQVIGEVDRFVLNKLIEEVLFDFVK